MDCPMNRQAERAAIAALQPGDTVYLTDWHWGRMVRCNTATVVRITKAHLILDNGDRYWRAGSKQHDYRIGERVGQGPGTHNIGVLRPLLPHVEEIIEEGRRKLKKENLISELRSYDYRACSMETLEKIKALLDDENRVVVE